MTVGKDERLSALVDDETGAFETRRLCDEMSRDASDCRRWEHYHLIGAAMRGELENGPYPAGFSDAVMKRIEAEAPDVRMPRRRGGRLVGIAAAASVAAMGFFGIQMALQQGDGQTTVPIAGSGEEVRFVAPIQIATGSRRPAEDPRLSDYLVNHAEHASRQGIVPYARLVSYEPHARPH